MHSSLCLLVWRRKLSVLLIASSIVLLALWSWAIYTSTSYSDDRNDKVFLIKEYNTGDNKHEYLIQKLISQANRILKYQRQQESEVLSPSITVSLPALSMSKEGDSIQQKSKSKSKSSVKFVKSTFPPSASLQPAPSLAARRKKASADGRVPLVSYLFEEERLHILQNQQKGQNDEPVMDYERILSSAERQSQYEHELQRMGVPIVAGIGPGGPRAPNERLVHFDLKGAPPKLTFLKRLLPIIKTLGATGLLIEYEDMFPFSGSLQMLAAKNAYKEAELKEFLESVAMYGLTVMPLVQTFGHLEFALKLQGFDHMREVPESPQSICPSQKVSISFIEEMVTQIIDFHLHIAEHYYNKSTNNAASSTRVEVKDNVPPNFNHIHIGCDEVARLGGCDKCRLRAPKELFLSHVTTISSFIRAKWPNLKVIIWDDMLRDMTVSEMQNSHIGNYVEPMIWVYATDIYHFIQPQLWDMYSKVFSTAWAASAFKGAFGESLMIPPLQKHLENNIRWLAVIAKEGGRFSKGFKGLALTGWQRYDHFSVLCELLPTSIPSLITTLSTVSKGYFSVDPKDNEILKVIECIFRPDSRRSGHPWLELQQNSHHSQLYSTCVYPGSLVYKYALRLFEKQIEVQNYLVFCQDKSGWMSDYNVRHNFSSPLRVRDLTSNSPRLIEDLTILSKEAHNVMNEIFDEHTIAEFVEQNIYPHVIALRKHIDNGQSLLHTKTWPRRPLPYAHELEALELVPGESNVNTMN